MVTLFKILMFLSLFGSITVHACMYKVLPDENFDIYESIFIGEITGIHLTEYESNKLAWLRTKKRSLSFTDVTPEYEVTVLPQRLKKGAASEVEKLKISGCGILVPTVQQMGLFFIKPNGDVDVLYNTESLIYEDYLEKVVLYSRNARLRLKVKRG